jgi:hypothetical protein
VTSRRTTEESFELNPSKEGGRWSCCSTWESRAWPPSAVARESGRFEECLLLQTVIVRLMVDALPLRIFLASPGDLEEERAAVRACVEKHGPAVTVRAM